MILPDVNVLVYAFRREAEDHDRYADWLSEAVAQAEIALVDTVLTGFLRVVTSPRIMSDPAPTALALSFVEALKAAPKARPLSPTPATWDKLRTLIAQDPQIRGPLVPDAWLAALALSHGSRLATADRGFARYTGLDWFVPVLPGSP